MIIVDKYGMKFKEGFLQRMEINSQIFCFLVKSMLMFFSDIVKNSSLMTSMALQSIWSLALALLDVYALVRKKILLNPALICFFAVGDGVISILSLAAASASAGVTVFYFNDTGHNCHFGEECQKYQISVAFAILSWISVSISYLIMLWLLGKR
ncbi:hypothetical protein KIW84_063374 [Lathyrus oleraceus]|uniref:CASP-like protein n=1 Tax=Pisum sativum TaxID=3888 RepID=A0A9D4W7H7_PEA|nr:hypothetical protein KIW84_063374 [Pisum sativum]